MPVIRKQKCAGCGQLVEVITREGMKVFVFHYRDSARKECDRSRKPAVEAKGK